MVTPCLCMAASWYLASLLTRAFEERTCGQTSVCGMKLKGSIKLLDKIRQ